MGKRGKEKLIRGFTARLSERFSRQGADAIGADANGADVTEECVTEDVRCAPAPPYGVHVWHDCPDAIIDICFIHGLTGDRDRTWTAHGQPHPWPKTLLAPKLEFGARILTYGYDAYLVSKGMASQNRLADHARNMVNDLATNRTSQGAANRPLVFVAHSLGGIICKKAILFSQQKHGEPEIESIFKCTKGIIFMGTPHRGAWMATWAKIPVSAFGIVKSTNPYLLGTLSGEEVLGSIQTDFGELLHKMSTSETPIEVTCFYEELALPLVGKVVSTDSATIPNYNAISIYADHREMARFSSVEDRGFISIVGLLNKWQREVRLGPSMRLVLSHIRQLLDVFGGCRDYLDHSPRAQQHRKAFDRTLLCLSTCKLKIEETYTYLFDRACVLQIESLMKRDVGWDDLQLQGRLYAYLQEDRATFQSTVHTLQQNLAYFRGKLGIADDFMEGLERDWSRAPRIRTFIEKWAVIQNSHDAPMYERLVRKIRKDVDRLVSCTPNTEGEAQESSQDAILTQSLTSWLDMRDHTHNLFDKLSHIWSYNCAAHQHQSKIRLTPLIHEFRPEQPSFNYSFRLHGDTPLARWRDVKISSRPRHIEDLRPERKGKKIARFVDYEISTGVTSDVGEQSGEAEYQIYDMCRTISQQFKAGNCMGMLSCDGFDYVVFDESLSNRELVPLRQLLPYFRNGEPIPIRQKRSISLSLATSLLLLYGTPYLPDHWSLDDVYMDPDDPTRLFRKQVFSRATLHTPETSATKSARGLDVVDNRPMFCLAVALLELTFGKPLSQFQERKGIADDQVRELITAKRLTKEIRKHEDDRFVSAVIKCMNPSPSSPTEYDFRFENESFRRQFIKDVLVPLYQGMMALPS